jgi:hypothetical protein
VISHHAPHPGCDTRLSDPPTPDEILKAAYRSDLTALMRHEPHDNGVGALKPAEVWIYGRTSRSAQLA